MKASVPARPSADEASAARGDSAAKKQIRGSSLLLVGRISSLGVNFVVQIVVIRYLTKGDFGAFAYALSLVSLGASIATFGLDRSITRFIPIYDEQGNYGKVFGTIVMAFGTVVSSRPHLGRGRLRAPGDHRWWDAHRKRAGSLRPPRPHPPHSHPGTRRPAHGDVRRLLQAARDLLPQVRPDSQPPIDGRPPARPRESGRRLSRSRVRRFRRSGRRALLRDARSHAAGRRASAAFLFRSAWTSRHARSSVSPCRSSRPTSSTWRCIPRMSSCSDISEARHDVAAFRVVAPAATLNQLVMTSFTLLFTPLAARLVCPQRPRRHQSALLADGDLDRRALLPDLRPDLLARQARDRDAVRLTLRGLRDVPRTSLVRLLLQRGTRLQWADAQGLRRGFATSSPSTSSWHS